MSKDKIRLDTFLVENKLCDSRNRAQRLIMAGQVLVDEIPVTHKGRQIPVTAAVRIKKRERYVSRGGEKLELAIKHLGVDFTGQTVLDIGISTGGFSDCALQHGAAAVVGVDVGYGQTAWRIRSDPRVELLERTNARHLELERTFTRVVCDVSFISLHKLLPVFSRHCAIDGQLICLVKPQFEAGREHVAKGGIVRDSNVHFEILTRLHETLLQNGFAAAGIYPSTILYPQGNIEYITVFVHERDTVSTAAPYPGAASADDLRQLIAAAQAIEKK